jgi:AcrR family transcriptional regulator
MLTRVSTGATPTFKRLPRAIREQQMLDAAVRVFSRRGFHAASMDEVAEEAGISKPMVYAYLGTKDALFIACLHREGTRLMEAIAAVVDAGDLPPDEQLWRGLRAFFGFVGAHRDGWAVLYRQARASEPFAAELAEMRRRIIDVVAGMLLRALAGHGRRVREAELEASAYALVGAGESLADWLADHPEEDPERTATRMMNFAWLGAAQLLRGEVWRP